MLTKVVVKAKGGPRAIRVSKLQFGNLAILRVVTTILVLRFENYILVCVSILAPTKARATKCR